mmetsp:Transcript_19878/g.29020  ORF Transcript_19878/g.29020 Transcript_19878/m.29020 type:complete len:147 (+) Transcript_19878:59-499(+)
MSEQEGATNTKPKCIPCESLDPSALLPLEKARAELLSSNLKLWTVCTTPHTDHMDKISKSFTAKNFQCALDAINGIGRIAEREGHHPDLHLTSWREVEIVIYTHSVRGVTMNDLALARMIDGEVKVTYSPKWLRENPDAQSTAAVK